MDLVTQTRRMYQTSCPYWSRHRFPIGFAGWFLLAFWAIAPALADPTASEYRQQGLMLRDQERYGAAIGVLQKAMELEPENLDGRVLLGWTQHKAGQDPEAIRTLTQTLSYNPFFVPALNALGIVYLVRGNLTQAALTHTWAAFLQANNEIAYYNLSLTYQGLQDYEQAISTAKQAARLEPDNPHPLVALAIAHWSQGDPALARTTYAQAIQLDPRYQDPAFLLYLNEAGFSSAQIALAQQIAQTLRHP